jgi:hypothetical protein
MKASPLAVRIVLLCAVLVALGYSAVGFVQSDARFGHPGPLTDPTDFVAFYCGGHVLAGGHDPYLAEPLRSCEEAAFAESRIQMIPHLVVPAPFPPYALALFAAFSLVPFRAACVVFLLLAVAAIAASIALAYRFTRFHVLAIAASLIVALTVGSVYIGQIVPLVVLALCASAAALSAQRVRLACAFALCTMIEPHVGLPVLLGLAVLERRARLPVAAGVLALALLSLAAGGLALNIEYAVRVLPAHALSEVSNFGGQYSLTALLYQFGLPAGAAVRAGDLWYLGTIVAGIALARRLRDAFGRVAVRVSRDGAHPAPRALVRRARRARNSVAEHLRTRPRPRVSATRARRIRENARAVRRPAPPRRRNLEGVDRPARRPRRTHDARAISLQAPDVVRSHLAANRCGSRSAPDRR